MRLSKDTDTISHELLHSSAAEMAALKDEIVQLESKISQLEDDAMTKKHALSDLSEYSLI